MEKERIIIGYVFGALVELVCMLEQTWVVHKHKG